MAKAIRDFKKEYARRVASATARGLTRAQARGHPRATERAASVISGLPLRGAARRAAEARQERILALPALPVVRWSDPTSGGTREVRTRSQAEVMRALQDAAARGHDAMVMALGSGGRHNRNYRATGRQRASSLISYLDGYDDYGESIGDIEGDGYDEEFSPSGTFIVKMFT